MFAVLRYLFTKNCYVCLHGLIPSMHSIIIPSIDSLRSYGQGWHKLDKFSISCICLGFCGILCPDLHAINEILYPRILCLSRQPEQLKIESFVCIQAVELTLYVPAPLCSQVNPFDLGRDKNWNQIFGENPWMWFCEYLIFIHAGKLCESGDS